MTYIDTSIFLGLLGNNIYFLLIIMLRNSNNDNLCYGSKFPKALYKLHSRHPKKSVEARIHSLGFEASDLWVSFKSRV